MTVPHVIPKRVRPGGVCATCGRVSRAAKGADCKSAGLRLRRFESYLSHHYKKVAPFALVLRCRGPIKRSRGRRITLATRVACSPRRDRPQTVATTERGQRRRPLGPPLTSRRGIRLCKRSSAGRRTRQECPRPARMYNQGLRSRSAGRVAEIHTPDHMAASRRERTTARGDGLRKRDLYKRDLSKYAACGAHLLLQPRVCRPILWPPRLDLPQAGRSFSALFCSAWANSFEG